MSHITLSVGKTYRSASNKLIYIDVEEDGYHFCYLNREKTRTRWYNAEGLRVFFTQKGRVVLCPPIPSDALIEEIARDPHLTLVAGGWYECALHQRYQLVDFSPRSLWRRRYGCSYYALERQETRQGDFPVRARYFTADGKISGTKDFLVRRLAQ